MDAACLLAEGMDWNSRTISYSRAKLKSRGGMGIKPALIRFGAEIEAILKRRPAVGPLFPYLRTVRAGGAINRCSANQILFFQNSSSRFSWTVVSGTTAPNTARIRRTIVHSGKTNFGGTKNVIGL
jgi:hypothetical protein